MSYSIKANQIKAELNSVIAKADQVEPLLAKRLRGFSRWIKNKKDGLLANKRLVLNLIIEIIQDSNLWIMIQGLTDEEKINFYDEALLSPPEKFWYESLFPEWFKKQDSKLNTWMQKLMADDFPRSDQKIIDDFTNEFKSLGQPTIYRYILDLSMATDLVISYQSKNPLAVQITSSNPSLLNKKQNEWEKTLIYWGIPRGLLFSHHPNHAVAQSVANLLENADTLQNNCYFMGISKRT